MADPSHVDEPSITPSAFSSIPFDFLIIGGGTAGLVIAARLSAVPNLVVGVVEAGPACCSDPLLTVPGRFGEALGSHYDWKFDTVPQPALGERTLAWPRGKLLGGTSALNFMTWTRGNRSDYDAWKELGNEGWGWQDMLTYFKRTEALHQSDTSHISLHKSHTSPSNHGTDGPVATVFSNEFSVPHQHWHGTLDKLGIETNPNHFSGNNLGAFTTLTSVDPTTRTRISSATAYYQPNADRPNLHVLTDTLVEKIEVEEVNGTFTATGVAYTSDGRTYVAKAAREVILCAGSVQSPQLLELSGIGDADILRAAGIDVKVANPNVGENLQDHMMTATIYELDPSLDLTGPDELRADPLLAKAAFEAYSTTQSGPYAMLPCALSYASLPQVIPPATLQSLLTRLPPPSSPRDEILHRQFSTQDRGQIEFLFDIGNWSPHYASSPGKVYGTMLMMLQLPLSWGSIHIRTSRASASASVSDSPVINPRYLEGARGNVDLDIMAEAQRFADRICRTSPLASIIHERVYPPPASPSPSPFPSPSSTHESRSESEPEDFRPWIKASLTTDWHPIGTCGMGGSGGIAAGVVDARLRVYGVQGLRVADASVMPLHICSHPQATVYAIGEKAADMVLQDYGLR